jgi:hypothetical protein
VLEQPRNVFLQLPIVIAEMLQLKVAEYPAFGNSMRQRPTFWTTYFDAIEWAFFQGEGIPCLLNHVLCPCWALSR